MGCFQALRRKQNTQKGFHCLFRYRSQREPDLPFSVLELNEVFTDEPAGKPDMRLIVNKDLIGLGYGKYEQIYRLSDVAVDKPLWLPDSKDELFEFHIDRFYLSEEGKIMTAFLSDLKSDGVFKMHGGKTAEIRDIEGNPVKAVRFCVLHAS